MTLPMSWNEWAQHDGVGLAARVRKGELPWTKLDDLHRMSLDKLVAEHGIAGLTEDDLVHINKGWHRLNPWADSVRGLARLKTRFIIGPLSNGNVSLLLNMAKHAGLPWDMVFGSDIFRHFKPDPESYLGVAGMMGLEPGEVMLAAAHNNDLAAATIKDFIFAMLTSLFVASFEVQKNISEASSNCKTNRIRK